MLNVFHTEDGRFHQAVLALHGLTLVRLVVERRALDSDCIIEWEWTVWPAVGRWEDCWAAVQEGKEPMLAAAKQQAFDAGISMLADMTQDYAPHLAAHHNLQSVNRFRRGDDNTLGILKATGVRPTCPCASQVDLDDPIVAIVLALERAGAFVHLDPGPEHGPAPFQLAQHSRLDPGVMIGLQLGDFGR